MTDSFIMYQSFYDAIDTLDAESQLALYKAISRYSFYDEEPDLTGAALGMWMLMKPLIDSNAEKRAKKQDAGRTGGKQTVSKDEAEVKQTVSKTEANDKQNGSKTEANGKQTVSKLEANAKQTGSTEEANGKQTGSKPEANVNVNVNVNDNVNGNVKGDSKGGRFTPPTVQEVNDYCRERNNGVDPERFVDFYASKGWKVGNQSMKDWKAAVRTWERPQNTPQNTGQKKNPFIERPRGDLLSNLENMAVMKNAGIGG